MLRNALLTRFASHLDATLEEMATRVVDATYDQVPGYRGVPREDLLQATINTLNVCAACWHDGRITTSDDLAFDDEVVRRRARQGVNAGDWIAHGRVFTDLVFGEMRRFARDNGHADAEALDVIVAMMGSASDHSRFAHEQFELAAAEIAREDDDRVRETMLAVLRGGLTAEKARAAATASGADPDALHHAVRIRPADSDLSRRLNRRESTVAGARAVWAHTGGEVVGLLPAGRRLDVEQCAGVGPPVAVEALATSWASATLALETAQRFGLRGARHLEDLGVLPLVAAPGPAADVVVERFVAAVERTGPAGRALLDTVATYLRSGLHPGKTAEELHLHPNSLRKRLARYADLTGADLRSMDDLAAIWWALKRREMRGG